MIARCVGLLLLLSLCASVHVHGHVTMLPNQVPGNVASFIGFQIPHSCNATSSTIAVEIQLPASLVRVVPINKAGWTYRMWNDTTRVNNTWGYTVRYDAIDANSYVANAAYDKIDLRLTFPNTPGVRLTIAVIQYCNWDLVSAWNQSSSSDPKPAPGITIISATDVQPVPTQANLRDTNALVGTLNTSLVSTSSIVSTLSTKYDSTSSIISTLSTQYNSTSSMISTLSTQYNSITTTTNNLQVNITELYQRINTLQQTIQALENKQKNINTNHATIISSITAIIISIMAGGVSLL